MGFAHTLALTYMHPNTHTTFCAGRPIGRIDHGLPQYLTLFWKGSEDIDVSVHLHSSFILFLVALEGAFFFHSSCSAALHLPANCQLACTGCVHALSLSPSLSLSLSPSLFLSLFLFLFLFRSPPLSHPAFPLSESEGGCDA